MKTLAMNQVFEDHRFVEAVAGRYPVLTGWYPLLGLPGVIDLGGGALMFCKLQKAVEAQAQAGCLNGVIEKIRIHRSARVHAPDTMLVLASDLLREFEVCQIPWMSDTEAEDFVKTIRG